MQKTSADLSLELVHLEAVFSALSERLARAAEQFRQRGVLPSEDLVSALSDYEKSFTALANRVLEQGRKLSLPAKQLSQLSASTLDDLKRSLQLIAEFEEQGSKGGVTKAAVAALDRALCIVRRDRAIFPPLQSCQAKVRKLRDEIMSFSGSEIHPAVRELAEGKQAVSRLLELIEHQGVLTDDECLSFHEIVAESFGKDLAIAALRGKLEVQPAAVSPSLPTQVEPPAKQSDQKPSLPAEPRPIRAAPERKSSASSNANPFLDAAMEREIDDFLANLAPSPIGKTEPVSDGSDAAGRDLMPAPVAKAGSQRSVGIGKKESGARRPELGHSFDSAAAKVFIRPTPPQAAPIRIWLAGIVVVATGALFYAGIRFRQMDSGTLPPHQPTSIKTAAAADSPQALAPPLPQQPEEMVQPKVVPEEKVIANAATPPVVATPTPVRQQQSVAQPNAIASPRVVVMPRPIQQQQAAVRPNVTPQQAITREEPRLPPPPNAVIGVPGVTGAAAGSVASSLLNPVASMPPPPALPPQRIRVGGVVAAAKLVRQTKPVYPPMARQARIEGAVRLEAIISQDGSIKDLRVLAGHLALTTAATAAVKQWRYEPTLLNGVPTEVITTIDVAFTLGQ